MTLSRSSSPRYERHRRRTSSLRQPSSVNLGRVTVHALLVGRAWSVLELSGMNSGSAQAFLLDPPYLPQRHPIVVSGPSASVSPPSRWSPHRPSAIAITTWRIWPSPPPIVLWNGVSPWELKAGRSVVRHCRIASRSGRGAPRSLGHGARVADGETIVLRAKDNQKVWVGKRSARCQGVLHAPGVSAYAGCEPAPQRRRRANSD